MKSEFILKGIGNRNLNIMFGDFCYYNRHTLHERYTPLGIGIIAQYTKEQFGEDVEVSIYKNIQIIRPFLSFSKKEILNFNKRFNLKYVNDPSNYNVKYTRSVVRKYLYENKSMFNKIIKDFNLIRNHYLQYKKMIFQILHLVILEIRLKKIVLDIKKLLKLEHELQVKLLDISIKFLNNNKLNVRYKKIEDIVKIIQNPINVSLKTQNILIKKNNANNIVILSMIK